MKSKVSKVLIIAGIIGIISYAVATATRASLIASLYIERVEDGYAACYSDRECVKLMKVPSVKTDND